MISTWIEHYLNETIYYQRQTDQMGNNMKSILLLAVPLMLTGAASAATTEETDIIGHGEELHQADCSICHGDEVYTRDDRFIKSLQALNKQVLRCRDNTGAAWFDEDTEAVVKFLDSRYYRF